MKKEFKDLTKLERFYQAFCNETFGMFYLNILFLITSIPIITTGPSAIALSKILCKFLDGKEVAITKEYFHEFKSNFKNGMIYGVLEIILIGLIIFSIYIYYGNVKTYPFLWAIILIGVFLVIFINVVSFYFYPMAGFVDLPLKTLISNSVFLSIKHLKTSLFSLFVFLILFVLEGIYIEYTFPIVAIIAVSLASLLMNAFIYPILKKETFLNYEEEKTEDSNAD